MNATKRMQEHTREHRALGGPSAAFWLIAGIVFIAMNMRAPLTSVGPLSELIRGDLQLTGTWAGMITTLPLLAFALLSPFVPRLGRRYGMERVLLVAILFLFIGTVLRSASGTAALFGGTAILGLAIAVCNVLLPGLIKRDFPDRLGVMTGVYSISMNLCGAIASGISVPLAVGAGLGWKGALGVWGILSFVALLVWLPQLRSRQAAIASVSSESERRVNVWRSPLAWQITLFMGIQSMLFYVLIAWLPDMLRLQGVSSDQSGWLLSMMQLAVLPFTFIVPVLAARMSNQRILVVFTSVFILAGTLGLLYGSSNLLMAWIILLGMGIGFAFSLSMMFFGLRTRTSRQAAELSGMAQSVGYLLAATGPTLFGFLHDATQSWKAPLMILVAASVLLGIVGLGAAKNRYVE
ncbi:MFS transporter [Paenibacillus paeoniae]|uniref:MFS transporter n=2 Tax=Paenibacillus paeoniae TaxID=2292705 RepID=A0A371PEB4_9BACL|nr:MFS transporter [Paenibacillus paeoniae]REK74254.1 MFS transporter [Paenibacillus paeoniae]